MPATKQVWDSYHMICEGPIPTFFRDKDFEFFSSGNTYLGVNILFQRPGFVDSHGHVFVANQLIGVIRKLNPLCSTPLVDALRDYIKVIRDRTAFPVDESPTDVSDTLDAIRMLVCPDDKGFNAGIGKRIVGVTFYDGRPRYLEKEQTND